MREHQVQCIVILTVQCVLAQGAKALRQERNTK
jgi:hypothetical protein